MFKGKIVPINLFVMCFVRLRLTFNLRPNLKVKEYCECQNLAKCYNGSLWKSNQASGPFMGSQYI